MQSRTSLAVSRSLPLLLVVPVLLAVLLLGVLPVSKETPLAQTQMPFSAVCSSTVPPAASNRRRACAHAAGSVRCAARLLLRWLARTCN